MIEFTVLTVWVFILFRWGLILVELLVMERVCQLWMNWVSPADKKHCIWSWYSSILKDCRLNLYLIDLDLCECEDGGICWLVDEEISCYCQWRSTRRRLTTLEHGFIYVRLIYIVSILETSRVVFPYILSPSQLEKKQCCKLSI